MVPAQLHFSVRQEALERLLERERLAGTCRTICESDCMSTFRAGRWSVVQNCIQWGMDICTCSIVCNSLSAYRFYAWLAVHLLITVQNCTNTRKKYGTEYSVCILYDPGTNQLSYKSWAEEFKMPVHEICHPHGTRVPRGSARSVLVGTYA